MFDRAVCPCYEREWQKCEELDQRDDYDELALYHAADRLRSAMTDCPHRPASSLKLARLLSDFYATTSQCCSYYLNIEYTGATFYRLLPIFAENPGQSKKETLALCQAEMSRFAAFLKKNHTEMKKST